MALISTGKYGCAICASNTRFKLSRPPAVVNRSGPALGHDSQYVFEKILGYSESRISELVAGGVLG